MGESKMMELLNNRADQLKQKVLWSSEMVPIIQSKHLKNMTSSLLLFS